MKTETHDIETLDDVMLLVNDFYGKVRQDSLLAGIFNNVIRDRWPEHLEKMYRFWQTVLLSEYTYKGTPFPPHAQLPVNQAHFERWLQLFEGTVNVHFSGKRAERAKWQGHQMAKMFLSKIRFYNVQNSTSL